MKYLRLITNSLSHLFVDMACFFVLYKYVANISLSIDVDVNVFIGVMFLTYNFIAFGLQFLFGYLYDTFPKIKMSFLGVTFVIVGVSISIFPVVAMILVALGNAMFHVGGGSDTLIESKGFSESGVFVSFGAIGVYVGTFLGKNTASLAVVILPLVICAAAELFFSFLPKNERSPLKVLNKKISFTLTLCILFVAITIRAFLGNALQKPDDSAMFSFIAVLCVFLGKFIGGFAADLLSPKKTVLIALTLSSIFAVFYRNEYCYLASILLFNVAMPITLYGLYSALPKNPGLAFGLSTLALLIGTIPIFFVAFDGFGYIAFIVSSLLVALGLCVVFEGRKKI